MNIIDLARKNRWPEVIEMIEKGQFPELYPQLLYLAANKNNSAVVRMLLDKDVPPTFRSQVAENQGATALHWAVYSSNIELLTSLIEKGAELSDRAAATNDDTPITVTPIEQAAITKKWPVVSAIARLKKAMPHYGYEKALSMAVLAEDIDAATALLESGAKTTCDPTTTFGGSILHAAVYTGNIALIKLLIEKKEDDLSKIAAFYIEKSLWTGTPIQFAVKKQKWGVVSAIAKTKAAKPAYRYDLALFDAVKHNKPEAITALLESDAETTWHDPMDGSGILHWAAQHNNTEVVSTIISRSQDLARKNNRQKTPIQIAAAYNHWDLVRIFIQADNASRDEQIRISLDDVLSKALAAKKEFIIDLLLPHFDRWHGEISDELIHQTVAAERWDFLRKMLEHHPDDETLASRVLLQTLAAGNEDIAKGILQQQQTGLRFDPSTLRGATKKGYNALHWAAYHGFTEIATILIEHHAQQCTQATQENKTAIQIAAEKNHWAVCEFLFRKNPNSLDAKTLLKKYGPQAANPAIPQSFISALQAVIQNSEDLEKAAQASLKPAAAENPTVNTFDAIYDYFATYFQTTSLLSSDQINFKDKDFKARLDNFCQVLAAVNKETGEMNPGNYTSVSFKTWRGRPSRYQMLRNTLLALSDIKRQEFFTAFSQRLQALQAADSSSLAARILEMASGASPAEGEETAAAADAELKKPSQAAAEENYFQNIYNYLNANSHVTETKAKTLYDRQKEQFKQLLQSIDNVSGALNSSTLPEIKKTTLGFFSRIDVYETAKQKILKCRPKKRLEYLNAFKEVVTKDSLKTASSEDDTAGAADESVEPVSPKDDTAGAADERKRSLAQELLSMFQAPPHRTTPRTPTNHCANLGLGDEDEDDENLGL